MSEWQATCCNMKDVCGASLKHSVIVVCYGTIVSENYLLYLKISVYSYLRINCNMIVCSRIYLTIGQVTDYKISLNETHRL